MEFLSVYPELAVQVISRSNTRAEIARKLREFFFAGMRIAWVIFPKKRVADIYTAPDDKTRIDIAGSLDAGAAIPGFRMPMADLFARTRRRKDDPT